MSGFHFPQYEHELFWRYYDILHAFLTHCDYHLEKWKLFDTVNEDVNRETHTLLDQWNFCAKSVDEACDFLDWLARDTHEFETSCFDSYIPSPCILTYTPPVCEICYCSDHDNTSCPYYVSNEGFARLSSMIETMNKQQAKFENKMREFDLSHETNLRFSSPNLDVCLCDDGASFSPLESGLEVGLDPPLTTLPIVPPPSPSSLCNNTTFNMTLPDPLLPLAQSTEFKVGETFSVNASVDEDDIRYESDYVFIEVRDSDAALVGRSYGDVVVTMLASPDLVENMSSDHLDISHAFPSCSLFYPPFKCHNMSSIDFHDMLMGLSLIHI